MDHSEALQLQAAEKYVLGELSPALRDAYEEHYFDCQECAADLEATVAFVDASRDAFRSGLREAFEPQPNSGISSWFRWLRPAVVVPAMAVLAVALAYQNFVTIPHLQRAAATPTGSASFISLIGANSRGEAAKSFAIRQNQPVILEVDIPPSSEFSSYLCEVQDDAGHVVHDGRVSAGDAKRSIHLIVPGGALQARAYKLRVLGQKDAGSASGSQPEVARLRFAIEFLP
jgi:hypothetical protein